MESRLREAAFQGNVDLLNQLLKEDESVLDSVSLISCSNYGPLHLAAMRGHAKFVEEILARNPKLSLELEPRRESTALHLASAGGHSRVVGALLGANPEACWVLDREGMNPLHVAAIRGQIGVLGRLAESRPLAARERTKRGESVLHLCVKYEQLEGLKASVEAVGGDGCEFLNQRDADGHTALHLAVLSKQIEIIQYLLRTGMDVNAKNANGLTAVDIVPQNPIEIKEQIENCLQEARALKAEQMQDFSRMQNNNNAPAAGDHQLPNGITPGNNPQPRIDQSRKQNRPNQGRGIFKCFFGLDTQELERKSKALMVVASLITIMTFKAGLNPPGGAWQDDLSVDWNGNPVPNPHRAGESIMAYHKLHYYKFFLWFNTTAFVSSLCTILLLISGLPFKNDVFMWVLRVVMWVTATSITATYAFSITYVTLAMDGWQLGHIIEMAIGAWSGLITLILLGKLAYSVSKWWENGRKIRWPCGRENQD